MNDVWINTGSEHKIETIYLCLSCRWVSDHPIKYCLNCGESLRPITSTEKEHRQFVHEFMLKNPRWLLEKRGYFDPETGKPTSTVREREQKS